MSPKNSVLSLSELSLKIVSNLLIHTLSDTLEKYEEEAAAVERYLSETTSEVLQDLLAFILRLETLDASTRFSCFEVILREDVHRLDTGMFPNFYYGDILRVIKLKGTGLRHLNLKGVWLRNMTIKLAEVLETMPNLRVLLIPHMADDLVLEAIDNLKKLTVLDISGECAFTREGLTKLKCDSLTVLDVGYYGKEELWQKDSENESVEIIASLIKQLPNLTVLKTYSFTGKALLKIHQEETKPKFVSKLKYIHDINTTVEVIKAVILTCPKIESLNFCNPDPLVVTLLHELNKNNKLNCVKLSRLQAVEVKNYLGQTNNGVSSLSLTLVKDGSLDISSFALTLPDLSKLKCFKTSLICLQPDNYFVNLQTLEILYCDISDSVLIFLLKNSPFLRRVIISDELHVTDGDIFRLCAESSFECLEELWLFLARGLTTTSVELLMGHCPNLKVLGQISGWNVSAQEIDYLRAVIASTNTDLILHPQF